MFQYEDEHLQLSFDIISKPVHSSFMAKPALSISFLANYANEHTGWRILGHGYWDTVPQKLYKAASQYKHGKTDILIICHSFVMGMWHVLNTCMLQAVDMLIDNWQDLQAACVVYFNMRCDLIEKALYTSPSSSDCNHGWRDQWLQLFLYQQLH